MNTEQIEPKTQAENNPESPLEGVSKKIESAEQRIAEKEARLARERALLVVEIANFAEKNKELDERMNQSRNKESAYRELEKPMEEEAAGLEKSVADQRVKHAGLAEKVKNLKNQGEDTADIEKDLEMILRDFEEMDKRVGGLRNGLEEMRKRHGEFAEAQGEAVKLGLDFAVDNATMRFEKTPEKIGLLGEGKTLIKKLEGEEREELKKEVQKELGRRENARMEQRYLERDKENISQDREIIESVRRERQGLAAEIEVKIKDIETKLNDPELTKKAQFLKKAILDRAGKKYYRIKSTDEAVSASEIDFKKLEKMEEEIFGPLVIAVDKARDFSFSHVNANLAYVKGVSLGEVYPDKYHSRDKETEGEVKKLMTRKDELEQEIKALRESTEVSRDRLIGRFREIVMSYEEKKELESAIHRIGHK